MNAYVLAIGIPVAVLIGGLAVIMRRERRDDDPAPFNWQGTVPAAPGLCSCGAPHARTLAPFPPETAPALPEMIAAPVAEPPAGPSSDDIVAELAAKVYGHGGDTAATEESNWHKADGRALAAKLNGDAS